jgi:uncharacterized protein with FMN-binding domain
MIGRKSTAASASDTQTADNSQATTPVDTTNTPTQQTVTTPPPVIVQKSTTGSVYKDGTYTATGTYDSPGGLDNLGVSITIKGDVVTDATVTNMAGDRESSFYQNKFISGYKPYVIGKNIASINLTGSISGSSLTPIGFNKALATIKAQAKS